MKKSLKLLYISLFFLFLWLPLLLMPFWRNDSALEKRAPAPFPALITEEGVNLQFSDQYENWLNGALPLRSRLLTVSNALRGELLGQETANVAVGRDGWLFYASELPDALGLEPMDEAQLRSIAVTLSLLQERTEAGGGRFTFAPVPNKSSVYPEELPGRYRSVPVHDLDRLQALLPEYGVNCTDLLSVLGGAKEQGVYHRRDSHWNNRGALLGANAILDSLSRPHEDHADAPFTEEEGWRGDLDKLLLPAGGVPDRQIVYDVEYRPFVFTQPRGVEDTAAQLASFMSDREERDMLFSTENLELRDGSSLYMARDSFGRALLPWMIDSYETTVFRRTDAPDLRTLALGTDVVFEIVERNLPRLLEKAPLVYAPERHGLSAAGCPLGEELAVRLEEGAALRVCGGFPAGAEAGDGRVYLLLEGESRSLCLEAFPVYEQSLPGEGPGRGFSACLSPELALTGSFRLTVLSGGIAYPCGELHF